MYAWENVLRRGADVLGFRPHDVVAMLDADGVKAHLRPTKANIVRAAIAMRKWTLNASGR
jgi:hypothetical protein